MKPRSVISLIISAAVVLCGIIVCIIATVKAGADGVMLFPREDINGNLIYSTELNGTTKINISVADADIIVTGGAETSSVEIVNFNANYYKLTQSNGSLNFAQIDDFLSMFKFWDNGFSFKGMRYILRFGDDAAGEKKIIVSLSDKDNIRLVNLSTDTGDITVENCSFAADYTIKAENGNAYAENLKGSSSLNIYGNTGDVTVKKCDTSKLAVNGNNMNTAIQSVEAESATVMFTDGTVDIGDFESDVLNITTAGGNVKISDYRSADGSITSESGTVKLGFKNTDSLAAYVTTKNGKISVNDKFTDSYSLNSSDPSYKITVNTSSGDVYITDSKNSNNVKD